MKTVTIKCSSPVTGQVGLSGYRCASLGVLPLKSNHALMLRPAVSTSKTSPFHLPIESTACLLS
jgi:hypothetical protein